MILFAALLVISASIIYTTLLKLNTKPAWLVSLYLLAYANIVLTGEIANLFGLLNRQWVFLLIHAILLGSGFWLWQKKDRPDLRGPFANLKDELRKEKLLNWLKNWPDLALFALGIAALFALTAIINLNVPQNNNDSLSTHISRIGYWYQWGHFSPWPTSRVFQLMYPINAQLQMFWSILFIGSDKLIGFTQWMSALAAAVGIFGLARLLGWGRSPATFAGFAYLSYPLVILQTTTTQNDIVAAGLFVPTVFLLLLGLQEKQRGALLLSALGVALGLGTKQTFYFLLPGLGVSALLAWLKFGKQTFNDILFWGMSVLASFILFGAYMNVINWQQYGNPFGPPDIFESSVGETGSADALGQIKHSVPRLLYQAIDTSGLPRPYTGYAHKAKAYLAQPFFAFLQFDIEGTQYTAEGHEFLLTTQNEAQEDHAWYGLVSALFLFPAMLWQLVAGVRQKEWLRVGLVLNFVAFLLVTAWLRPGWDPYQGRYFAPVFALNTPFIAMWIKPTKKARISRWLIVGLSLLIAWTSTLYNPAKPLIGKYSDRVDVWRASRVEVQTMQSRNRREMLFMVEEYVPADATLGLLTPGYLLDYPLFGEYFERALIPIYPLEQAENEQWLAENGIEYILAQFPEATAELVPAQFELVVEIEEWALYERK